MSRINTTLIIANLKANNARMATQAADVLHGITPEFATDLSRLGHDAAASVERNRYKHVRIRLEPEAIVIERETGQGEQEPERYDPESVKTALIESGIGKYLTSNHGVTERTAEHGIEQLWRQGTYGVIFDSTAERPGRTLRAVTRNTGSPPELNEHERDKNRDAETVLTIDGGPGAAEADEVRAYETNVINK